MPELLVELGGQRLVVGQHQRGPAHGLDHPGHRVRLAAAGDSQQHLVPGARPQAGRQLLERLLLVALRPEARLQPKRPLPPHLAGVGDAAIIQSFFRHDPLRPHRYRAAPIHSNTLQILDSCDISMHREA